MLSLLILSTDFLIYLGYFLTNTTPSEEPISETAWVPSFYIGDKRIYLDDEKCLDVYAETLLAKVNALKASHPTTSEQLISPSRQRREHITPDGLQLGDRIKQIRLQLYPTMSDYCDAVYEYEVTFGSLAVPSENDPDKAAFIQMEKETIRRLYYRYINLTDNDMVSYSDLQMLSSIFHCDLNLLLDAFSPQAEGKQGVSLVTGLSVPAIAQLEEMAKTID